MGKTLYGQYLDTVGKIWINLSSCAIHEVRVFTSYILRAMLFPTFHVDMKVKVKIIEKNS